MSDAWFMTVKYAGKTVMIPGRRDANGELRFDVPMGATLVGVRCDLAEAYNGPTVEAEARRVMLRYNG